MFQDTGKLTEEQSRWLLSHELQALARGSLELRDKTDRNDLYRVSVKADILTIEAPIIESKREANPQVGGGRRKAIRGFSRKSRRNLLRKLASLRDVRDGYFATLTYADPEALDHERRKRDIAALRKRLLRAYPEAWGVWKLELETRKSGEHRGCLVSHFHMLIFCTNVQEMEFRENLRRMWAEIVNSGDDRHFLRGSFTEPIRNRRKAMNYASKYVAKATQNTICPVTGEIIPVGRFWGFWGEPSDAESLSVELTRMEIIELRRMAVRYLKSKGSGYAKRLARQNVNYSWSVMGLGDESCEVWKVDSESTAWKMLLFLLFDGK